MTCSFGSVVKGTYPDKSIVVTTTAAGSMTAAATLTGTLFDHNLGNNQAFAPTTVGDGANLALTKTEPYDPALLGAPFTYTLTASNLGPSPVTSASIVDTLPAACDLPHRLARLHPRRRNGHVRTGLARQRQLHAGHDHRHTHRLAHQHRRRVE